MSSKSWREEYSKYLKSAKWKKKRIQALDYHGAACACCGSTNLVQVHHISYQNYPGNEKMTDLIPLCKRHHKLVHKLIGELRETYKNIDSYNWLKASKEAIKAITSSEYKQRPKKKKVKKPKKKKYVPRSKRKKTKKPKLTRSERKQASRRKEELKRKADLKLLNHSKEPFLSKESLKKLENTPGFIEFVTKK